MACDAVQKAEAGEKGSKRARTLSGEGMQKQEAVTGNKFQVKKKKEIRRKRNPIP